MKNLKLIIPALLCLLALACNKKADNVKPQNSGPLTIIATDRVAATVTDSLRITGTGFSTDSSKDIVTINGMRASILRASSTQISVMIPARCFDGYIKVQVGSNIAVGPKFTYIITTGIVTTLAGNPTTGNADGVGKSAQFNSPQGLAIDSLGNLFVGDVFNYRIRKITVKDGTVTTFAVSGNLLDNDAPGKASQFGYLSGLAVDKAGTLYFTDNSYNNVRALSSDGTHISTVAGGGNLGNTKAGYQDGVGTAALFHGPNGIVFDNDGNLLVADQRNSAIRKITLPNTVSTYSTGAGKTPNNPSVNFGVIAGMAYYPPDGSLYIADVSHNWIDRLYSDATYLSSFGNGTPGLINGYVSKTEFNNPTGVAMDNFNIYITDQGNNCIRMIDGYYNVTTLVGSNIGGYGSGGYADGKGTAVKFANPSGIVLDRANRILYVADAGNNCIRKVALE